MINVTQPYLPSIEKYKSYIDRIYETGWLTNNGFLLQTLEKRLAEYLGVKHLIIVTNGSLALQIAYKALDLSGEVLTTPFSFAATTSTIAWEGLTPIFSDICPQSFNLSTEYLEEKISKNTSAIVPVHVFGNPCDVLAIRDLALKYNLKVIYDAAHAFGVKYKNESVLNYGDISILSFHATKLFHTIEGGALITDNDQVAKKIRQHLNFGFSSPIQVETVGTNAKMNEFQAAMGLCVLDDIDMISKKRKQIWSCYQELLDGYVTFQKWNINSENNCSYAPILLESEEKLLKVEKALKENQVTPRRYFYPSLDTLTYIQPLQIMPVSRDIASRILCLPIYPSLDLNQATIICEIIKGAL